MDFLQGNLGIPTLLSSQSILPQTRPPPPPGPATAITASGNEVNTRTRPRLPLRHIVLIRQHTLLDGAFHLRSGAVPEDTKLVMLVDQSNTKIKQDLPDVIARIDFGQDRFASMDSTSGGQVGVWPPLLDIDRPGNVARVVAGDMHIVLAQVGARDEVARIVQGVAESTDPTSVAVALVGDFELTYAERNRVSGSGRQVMQVSEYEDLMQVFVDLNAELAMREGRAMLVEIFKAVLRALDKSYPTHATSAESQPNVILDSRTLLAFLHNHIASTTGSPSCITPGLLLNYLVRTRALIPTDAAFIGSESPNDHPTPAIHPTRGLLYYKSDEYMAKLLNVAVDTTGRLRFDSLPRIDVSASPSHEDGPQLPRGQVVESTPTATSILTYPDLYPDAKNPISVLTEYFQRIGVPPPKVEAVAVGSMGSSTQMYVGVVTLADGEQMQGVRALPKKKLAEQDVCKVALVKLGIVRPSPQLVMVMRAAAGRHGQMGVKGTGGCGVVQGATAHEQRAAAIALQSVPTHSSHTNPSDPSSRSRSAAVPNPQPNAAICAPISLASLSISSRPLLAKALENAKHFDSALFEHFALATPRQPEPSMHVYSVPGPGQDLFGCKVTMVCQGQTLVIDEPAVHSSKKPARDAAARNALIRIGVL